jgi:hypothetical protein
MYIYHKIKAIGQAGDIGVQKKITLVKNVLRKEIFLHF